MASPYPADDCLTKGQFDKLAALRATNGLAVVPDSPNVRSVSGEPMVIPALAAPVVPTAPPVRHQSADLASLITSLVANGNRVAFSVGGITVVVARPR